MKTRRAQNKEKSGTDYEVIAGRLGPIPGRMVLIRGWRACILPVLYTLH